MGRLTITGSAKATANSNNKNNFNNPHLGPKCLLFSLFAFCFLLSAFRERLSFLFSCRPKVGIPDPASDSDRDPVDNSKRRAKSREKSSRRGCPKIGIPDPASDSDRDPVRNSKRRAKSRLRSFRKRDRVRVGKEATGRRFISAADRDPVRPSLPILSDGAPDF